MSFSAIFRVLSPSEGGKNLGLLGVDVEGKEFEASGSGGGGSRGIKAGTGTGGGGGIGMASGSR
jgi:hypothetical protein